MTTNTIKYYDLFISFLKIGLFTFGGGYAMIPLIEREVVTHRKWVKQNDFIDLLTIAQSVPGPIALNSAAFVGYKSRGYFGAFSALFGVILPSLVIILIVAMFFNRLGENAIVEAAFKAMRPVVVALIVAPTISLMKGMHPAIIAITILVMLIIAILGISPIYLIFSAIVIGSLWTYRLQQRAKSNDERGDEQ